MNAKIKLNAYEQIARCAMAVHLQESKVVVGEGVGPGTGAEKLEELRGLLRNTLDDCAALFPGGLSEAMEPVFASIVREPNLMLVEAAARAAHEVNRAYCLALGDASQVPWDEAPEWQKASARHGAELHLSGEHGPAVSHEAWLAEKRATGWKYGPVKDAEKKEHPCFVPFAELPWEQQAKDHIFAAVVRATRETWNTAVLKLTFVTTASPRC